MDTSRRTPDTNDSMPSSLAECHWHALAPDDCLQRLQVDATGLSAAEAERRLQRDGRNTLPHAAPPSALRRFLRQFQNVLIQMLVLCGVIVGLLGHAMDALVIFAVVIVNAVIAFVQEGKAERAMLAIDSMLAPLANVRRDGASLRIPAESLVRGDVVMLSSGDRVPADIRLLEAHEVRVDQSALTGESQSVERRVEAVAEHAALAERRGMLYAGTTLAMGQALGVVVATGAATEIGRISEMIEHLVRIDTPLLRQMASFARLLTAVIVAAAALMMGLAWLLHGQGWQQSFMPAVALAVAAIPEGLPAIITIALAVGVQRMAERKAIVRRLPAVETLGSVSVICSDKTGTLTRNELSVAKLGLGDAICEPDAVASLPELAEVAALASSAGPGQASNDSLELALLSLLDRIDVKLEALHTQHPRTALLPFSSERKLMATAHGQRVCMKGAPERVFERCAWQRLPGQARTAFDSDLWHQRLDALTLSGLRVLALAQRQASSALTQLSESDLGDQFELLGLVGFIDPPRAEAAAALKACREAGIDVKMITGDHADTALAIARQLGMDTEAGALTGPELDELDADTLASRAESVSVFARTSPENKLKLVEALQGRGRIVAMTGDGVNDAPALKRADIGVAMGIKGTEAARQAAEIVLADDNFATLVNGVEEGRVVYDNIRKGILFVLPTSMAQSLVILIAVLAGMTLPITPVQVLWINLVTAVSLAISLALEPPEPDVMRRRPRPADEGLLTGYLIWRTLSVGVLMTLSSFSMYWWALRQGVDQDVARSVAINTLVLAECAYLFNVRRWQGPSYSWHALTANPWAWWMVALLLILQLAVTYLPPLQYLLGTAAIGPGYWLTAVLLALLLFAIVEIEKALLRRWH